MKLLPASLGRFYRRIVFGSIPVTLVAMRYADMRVIHPDMTISGCMRCGAMVGLYPSGQRVIRRYGAERVTVLCQVCQPPAGLPPAPGALGEIGQGVRR